VMSFVNYIISLIGSFVTMTAARSLTNTSFNLVSELKKYKKKLEKSTLILLQNS
jgi:hypothetical protein